MPIVVLTGGQKEYSDGDKYWPAGRKKEYSDSIQVDLLNLSSISKQIIAEKSGHHIHIDESEAVTEAVKQLVLKIKNANRKMNTFYNKVFSCLYFIIVLLYLRVTQVHAQKHATNNSLERESALYSDFTFPENWRTQTGRSISIPVKVFKTSSTTPSYPIMWLGGGPGQSNMDFKPPFEFLENHDVILIGYRGVDGSVLLECPEINNAFKGSGPNLLSHESIENIKHAAEECATRFLECGIDLNGYTIEQVLFDIDSVRSYFKIDKLNLLSASYGTRVSQLYAKFHFNHVNKSVMIGANPPGNFVWEPQVIDKKIGDYNILCQQDPYCKGKTKNLNETFNKVFREMPELWLLIPIDPGKVKAVTFGMLYHKGSALQVIDSFLAAGEGDYSGIALMSVAYNFILPDMMVWGDFLSKGMIDYDSSRNYRNEFAASEFALGSPMSAMFMDIGKTWPVRQPGAEFSKLDTMLTSTLVLNGALDFSTPHELIEAELMPFLTNGKLVVFNGVGHVADLLYKSSIKRGIKKYYLTGEVQFDEFNIKNEFKIKIGFPLIAKIAIGLFFVLLLLLGFIFKRLLKRFKRVYPS
jgi:pimeloyl-ACP methyl ester carboxylesterase